MEEEWLSSLNNLAKNEETEEVSSQEYVINFLVFHSNDINYLYSSNIMRR